MAGVPRTRVTLVTLTWMTFLSACSGTTSAGSTNPTGPGPVDPGSTSQCQPKNCAELNAECGQVADGCGGVVICPDCANGSCGGAGANRCGSAQCQPMTDCSAALAAAHQDCGTVSDGCSATLDCTNVCPSQTACTSNGVCACQPLSCEEALKQAGIQCGSVPNGCGGTMNCSSCASNECCGCAGIPNVCSQQSLPPIDDPGTKYTDATKRGDLPDVLTGLSGIVSSPAQEGVLWVHNDRESGKFYAIDYTAALITTFTFPTRDQEDKDYLHNFEDITIGKAGNGWSLYLADTGDNQARESGGAQGRDHINVYLIPEPDAHSSQPSLTAQKLRFKYPVVPHDCEAVFLDHFTGDLYFVTKEDSPAEVFVARAPFSAEEIQTLESVGSYEMSMACGADMSTDGLKIVVRTYGQLSVHTRQSQQSVIEALQNKPVKVVSWPEPEAREAVTFERNGYGLYTSGEQMGDPPATPALWYHDWVP